MKSIKPGRQSSMMTGISGIVAVVFGIFWTISAVNMGAPIFFVLFGVFFVVVSIVQCIRGFKNATGENRESLYDITEDGEEIDPWEQRFRKDSRKLSDREHSLTDQSLAPEGYLSTAEYCPYCGTATYGKYLYCPKCGKQLPEPFYHE